jgi:hypothetical protein
LPRPRSFARKGGALKVGVLLAALRRAGRHRPGLLPRRRACRSAAEGRRPARPADHQRRHRNQRGSGPQPRRES